ncbi:hypothetical protein [Salipiger mucosus]|uniref:Cytochrome c domain-containing protein n=1 Tax=Salipiger mucosus DSM 16094 TaxID=1123237 RepID=S9R274_9RHOB|nr:hypothetical protein [Salipiger mucosus]EPX85992.1 hypothetical protein Salmuc_00808 [Salipiger mucosus DSM 16094]
MPRVFKGLATAAFILVPAVPVMAQDYSGCTADGWLDKSDEAFAADCAGMAFSDSLEDRERVAWMFFARVNQLIQDPDGDGMSGSGQVPVWMAWPTDPDTFDSAQPFDFGDPPRNEMLPSTEKKDILAGRIATEDPDGANEEVTRNKTSYDYLVSSGLTTKRDVAAFFDENDYVDMPVGSVELKASWLQVPDGTQAPEGALTFAFESDTYWWRGIHIMVKMQPLPDPAQMFYSEEPSWFWTTFEFNDNPGVGHVREDLTTQRAPLSETAIAGILETAGLSGFGFEAYAPNGTQIRFTKGGTGETPVILGHTDMEDFAGSPNTAQPRYWTGFEASCHSCHATAAYHPGTKAFFPFSVPTGALDPGYNKADKDGIVRYLGQGYKPLDFMWPIAFQAR